MSHHTCLSIVINRLSRSVSTWLLLTALAVLCGCKKEFVPEGMPKVYPTTLHITQEGEPLSNATVKLHPESPELAPWHAGGKTDEKGEVVLFTINQYRGVAEGKFKVCVEKIDMVDPNEKAGNHHVYLGPPRYFSIVDVKLRSPEKTTLEIDVKPGENSMEFEVGKPVRVPVREEDL